MLRVKITSIILSVWQISCHLICGGLKDIHLHTSMPKTVASPHRFVKFYLKINMIWIVPQNNTFDKTFFINFPYILYIRFMKIRSIHSNSVYLGTIIIFGFVSLCLCVSFFHILYFVKDPISRSNEHTLTFCGFVFLFLQFSSPLCWKLSQQRVNKQS